MVLGTSSGAGKSLLTAALCASLARRGLRVAPFKAQNMSNNARVVDGGEIGVAQWLQARAAGVEPSVDHNPVLLKPEADTRSQVVVLGRVNREITDLPWRDRSEFLWPEIRDAFDRLAESSDIVVLEGAGSPAEINLTDHDLVNHRIAEHSNARLLLVSDIDRGGSFAHLYGTWSLVGDRMRQQMIGFVLNKFRGDPTLLEPAPSILTNLTGVPVVGVVPMIDHGLPDEDGVDPRPTANGPLKVRAVCGPAASNLDEWYALRSVTSFSWATEPGHLADADLLILPGSKLVAADVRWTRTHGLDTAIAAAIGRGVPTIAVCGGLQLLGGVIADEFDVEEPATGLGVLPISTHFAQEKATRRVVETFGATPEPWSMLSGRAATGYEIRFGRTIVNPGTDITGVLPRDLGFVHGPVLATYVHGLFEDPDLVESITGIRPDSLQTTFDRLADLVDEHLDLDALLATER